MTTRQRVDAHARDGRGRSVDACTRRCVEGLREQPSESVDFSVYSPPFLSLYTYTNSERDLGNCSSREEFLEHYRYVVRELFRLTKPGRNTGRPLRRCATTKVTHGVIGLHDLPGD